MEHRVSALVNFYRLVQAERMQGVPILNPALSVEAVGFEWSDEGQTVAEGVETAEQLAFLQAHGCHYVQGYYLARPMSEQDYLVFQALAQNKSPA